MSKFSWGKAACAVFILCLATAIALPAQTFTTLFSFNGTDGANSYAGLVQATDGNLYGTTYNGGTSSACGTSRGCGTVFKITPGGTLTTLHSFDATDGADPSAASDPSYRRQLLRDNEPRWRRRNGLQNDRKREANHALQLLRSERLPGRPIARSGARPGSDGNFFGTTDGGLYSYGTVFTITPSGTLTTLYSFCSQSGCTDGDYPKSALVQASDGTLYGTTYEGGTSTQCSTLGCGTLFKITSERHADHALQLLLAKWLPGRRRARCGVGPGAEWKLLRDDMAWGRQREDDLPNHSDWHADDALPLLLAKRLHGRRIALGGVGSGHRRELLRHNDERRGQRLWHGLQNHPRRHTDDPLQLLLPERLPGR